MKKIVVVLALGMTLMPLHAQNKNGWNFETNFIHLNAYSFSHEHVLSECIRHTTVDSSGFHILDYGTDCEKVFLALPQKITVMPEVSYMWNQKRVGIRGWYINYSDDSNGSIVTPAPVENEDGSTTFYRGAIFVWKHSLGALMNTLNESQWADINWFAKNSLQLRTAETYFAQIFSRFFEMRAGIKFADIINKQTIKVMNRAYVNPYYHYYIWDNQVTLDQRAKAYTVLVGPYVGFKLNTKYISMLVQGAPLFTPRNNSARSYGSWDDIDDIHVDFAEMDSLYYIIYYDGDFSYAHKTRMLIPYGEIILALTYPIEYKNMIIRFGIGAFGSVFLNTPIAPIWQVPGRWTWRETTHWKTRERDLVFYGLHFNLAVEWKGGK